MHFYGCYCIPTRSYLAAVNLLNHILLFHIWNAMMFFKMCSETYDNEITMLNPCNLFISYAQENYHDLLKHNILLYFYLFFVAAV